MQLIHKKIITTFDIQIFIQLSHKRCKVQTIVHLRRYTSYIHLRNADEHCVCEIKQLSIALFCLVPTNRNILVIKKMNYLKIIDS